MTNKHGYGKLYIGNDYYSGNFSNNKIEGEGVYLHHSAQSETIFSAKGFWSIDHSHNHKHNSSSL